MQVPMQRMTVAAMSVWFALACSAVGAAEPSASKETTEAAVADAAVAERLCQIAQSGLTTRQIVPATLHQATSMLEGASKLNPKEPRYLRLLTEAYLQLGSERAPL